MKERSGIETRWMLDIRPAHLPRLPGTIEYWKSRPSAIERAKFIYREQMKNGNKPIIYLGKCWILSNSKIMFAGEKHVERLDFLENLQG